MKVEDAASSAVSSIVKESVLGALLIVAVILLVWLVRRVLAIQDLRVEDQKKMSERLEAAAEKQAELINKMTEAFSAFKVTLERLNNTWEQNEKVTEKLTGSVDRMSSTVDSVVRDAVRTSRGGRYSTTSTPPRDGSKGGG